MSVHEVEVVVVGAGQAGVAMSEHLTDRKVSHVVLEKSRIAERWRSERWDSLVANGPAWHDRFPNQEFAGVHPDAFPGKEAVADYFEEYAARFHAPIKCGVEVQSVTKRQGKPGFEVITTDGTYHALHVVAATGPFQVPRYPSIIPADSGLHQLHSSSYHNPEQLPAGNVLVVGAGSSGVQIADELQKSGRQVFLSVGAHDRPPRQYRGRDFVWWLGVLGKWEANTPPQGAEHVTIAVSGADGGHTVDFRDLANSGITLVGRTKGFNNSTITFEPGLEESIALGDENYLSILREADEYVRDNGLDLPEEPEAHVLGALPECVTNPLSEVDLAAAGITTVLWSTGFGVDYSWLNVDAFDETGYPDHQRGISKETGIYFLGLPWLSRRGSNFIWGVWHDARYVADQILIQLGYGKYSNQATAASKAAAAA